MDDLGASAISTPQVRPEERRLRRLTEFDADKRAARRMFDALLNDRVMLNAVRLDEGERNHMIGFWALMLGCLFLFLNSSHGDNVRASGHSYPHPEVRYWGVFQAFKDILPAHLEGAYHDQIQAAHRLLNRLWRAGGRDGDCYSNSRSRVDEVIDEANRLSSAVIRELYPLLLPYDTDQLLTRPTK